MKKLIFLTCLLALFANCLFAANEAIKPDGEGTIESPYLLTKVENLVWMGENIAECQSNVFRLENDIDASETIYWKNQYGQGFVPIGSSLISKDQQNHNFSGVLDGQGFAINNIYSVFFNSSLFNFIVGGNIRNLKLQNIRLGLVTGNRLCPAPGALANTINSSTITNVHITGRITGRNVGGFAQQSTQSSFVNCSFNGTIKSVIVSSGLAGGLLGVSGDCYISNCRTSGELLCTSAKDIVVGALCVGGMFGSIGGEKDVIRCFSDMRINSKGYVGGLAGSNEIENWNNYYGYVTTNDFGFKQCYSNCTIEKQTGATIGGLAGFTTNSVCFDCYYNSDRASGTVFGIGVDSSKIKQRSTFRNWDFSNVWGIYEGQSTPYFAFESGRYLKVALLSSCFGQISIEPEKDGYAFGETVTVTAIPEDGSEFLYFNGALSGAEAQQTLAIEDNEIIEAAFAKQISSIEMFSQIGEDYPDAGNYVQTVDFNLSGIEFTNLIDNFYGIYDGRNHSILNLKNANWKDNGLFGFTGNSLICNLNIIDAEADWLEGGILVSSIASDSVISNCYVSANVSNCRDNSGAICGAAQNSIITKCIFVGEFCGGSTFGGLCDTTIDSIIDQCGVEIYSEDRFINCFCGSLSPNTKLVNCFAKGKFNGQFGYTGMSASNCYLCAEGNVRLGISDVVNFNNCYFSSNCVAAVEGVTGFVSEEEMKKQETYAGWDFENVWDIEEGVGTPYFRYALPEPAGMLALFLIALFGIRKIIF